MAGTNGCIVGNGLVDVSWATNLNLSLAGLVERCYVCYISLAQKAIKIILPMQMSADLNKDTPNKRFSCDL